MTAVPIGFKYPANNQSITCTLASLTNGSARQSTALDLSASDLLDILVFIKVKSGAASTSTTGFVNVYALASADGGTTYTEGGGGSDAAITLTAPPNAILIGQINVVANATTYYGGPFSVAKKFGGKLPSHVQIVIENKSGGTLDATESNHGKWYETVQAQVG